MNTPVLAALALKNPLDRFRCEVLSAQLSFRVCAMRNRKRGQFRAGGAVCDAGASYPTCATCTTGAAIAQAVISADRLARGR